MKKLSYETLHEMNYDGYLLEDAPERVLQFGEGNFLRAFTDAFIDVMNEKAGFNSKVVICKPTASHSKVAAAINEQEGLYTLYLRGFQDGQKVNHKRILSCVSRCINPYDDFEALLACADNEALRFVVSNTTEAGIVYDASCQFTDAPASSYPGKLTQVLYRRFQKFGKESGKGLIILSCELIEDNGKALKKCVLNYAKQWELGEEFINWIEAENLFCSTLVDRIVTGFPRDEHAALCERIGEQDNMMDTAEIFHLWVIQGHHEDELPFNKAGYNIVWTDDVAPYKKRKVRILNGGHTSMVLGAYLYGLETVGECLKDETVSSYLKHCIFEEIVPTLGNTQTDIDFGKAVLERFANPFIRHMLLSIALNSVSKFQVRVLPTILEHKEKFGNYPEGLVMSMAALIAFYRTDKANDGAEIMEFMKTASVEDIMKREDYWHADLTEMIPMVQKYYDVIEKDGMKAAYDLVLNK